MQRVEAAQRILLRELAGFAAECGGDFQGQDRGPLRLEIAFRPIANFAGLRSPLRRSLASAARTSG